MSRIGRKFREVLARKGKAFIPYVMAGDPDLGRTREAVTILEECGADILELGVPFSDPLADGPTIQRAALRALSGNVTLPSVIGLVADLRKKTEMPIILMTYYNPVFRYGEERFVRDAVAAGVDGVIIPDLPPEEARGLIRAARSQGLDTIFLLAPTSTDERIRSVARASTGFIYYIPITGITGAELRLDGQARDHVAKIREVSHTPVAVGFGVSTPEEAGVVARFADGVIVGSAIVKRMGETDEALKGYLRSLREAIR